MIQHLVHKCRYCGNIVRITLTDGVITDVQGAKQYHIGWGFFDAPGAKSQKLLICTAPSKYKLSGTYECSREMKVSSFKPITL